MIKRAAYLLLVIFIIINISACKRDNTNQIKKDLFALNTYITFTLPGGDNAQSGLDAAIDRLKEIEQRMSATLPDSDISMLNANAGKQPVKVHEDTFYVIKTALQYSKLTDGAFDITTLPIGMLWNITGENSQVPSQESILQKLPLVDYKKVQLNEADLTVFLKAEGMMIDLGGIAKGYAGDEIARILKEHSVKNALINLGGNVVAVDGKENGTPWRIGIQNPRMKENQQNQKNVAVIETKGEAIVTSGDYERYMVEVFKKTGVRYHHIFDPKTGYPAKTGIISVTVVGKSGIDDDALSTSIFVMGLDKGLRLANELEDINVMIITEDKGVYFSKDLKDRVQVVHPDYHIEN